MTLGAVLTVTGCARTDTAPKDGSAQTATQNPVVETPAPSPTAAPVKTVIADEQKNGKTGRYRLGMTLEELHEQLDTESTEDVNEIEYAGDPGDWNQGHRTVMTESADFTLDEYDKLYRIDVIDDSPTLAGLKVGDTEADVIQLYGEDSHAYELLEHGERVLEYTLKDHYFTVLLQGQKVTGWGISLYKWGTNSPVTESYDQVRSVDEDQGTALKEKLYSELQSSMQKLEHDSNERGISICNEKTTRQGGRICFFIRHCGCV